jgi:hypothetical protein
MSALAARSRLPGWLLVGSVAVLVATVVAFGSAGVRTPEFNRLTTVPQVAAYIAERSGTVWVALDLGLLLGCGLMYAALLLVARTLWGTNARTWGIVGAVALSVSAVFLVINTYLMIGLAGGPDRLLPFVAQQTVSPERAVVGVLYEHLAGLTGGIGLAFIGIGLFASRRMRWTGLVVAVLAGLLTVAGVFFGAVVGPLVVLSLPIGFGLIRGRRA